MPRYAFALSVLLALLVATAVVFARRLQRAPDLRATPPSAPRIVPAPSTGEPPPHVPAPLPPGAAQPDNAPPPPRGTPAPHPAP